jgi:disulfide bond formation protein DsbB
MTTEQQIHEAAKIAPAITVSGMTFLGFAVQDWLIILTIVYTVLQISLLVRRMVTAKRASDTLPVCAEDCPLVRRK